ncbi:hypothetical protein DRJ04_04590 [Candidatus Aerophobetes bacterium]|uniref:Uncharacterized protein n=1 Tax=Aerophobetes bacterium TaxID=2030807 RepID=A0A662DEK1_UNCAE|nr:MAG: hypothetical protein DRJ04_04590 [Candidatus Aerophobetes bacterium]
MKIKKMREKLTLRKDIRIGKLVLCIILLWVGSFVAQAQEAEEGLVPTLKIEEAKPSSDYFGLEIKWSIEKDLGSGISAKITYMDPEVYLAYVNYLAKKRNFSPQKKEEKTKEVINLLKEFLIFKVLLKHNDNPDYTKITNWKVFLVDDEGNKYSPKKFNEGKAELRRGFAGPYYGRISYLYFSKTNPDGKPILGENTRWMKIQLSQSSQTNEFKWEFFQQGKIQRSPFYFYPYLKISLVLLLIFLIFLVWITRPGKYIRNIKSI